jgi:carboxyl-terminal processing protease
MKNKHFFPVVLLVLTLGIGFFAGTWMPRDDDFFALRKNFEIFGSVYEELVTDYVDPLDPERMMRNGLEAMLEDLDPYTVFFDEADNADIDIITRGRYGGVGLNVQIRNGRVTVSSPVENASGYKQGVRAGDIITHIGGQSTEGLSMNDLGNLMRGEPGTAVEFIIEREGEPEPLLFMLTREEVRLKNVTYSDFARGDTASGIAYVKLERFGQGAAQEVKRNLMEMQKAGALKGVILDLRDNPGGLLDDAVEIVQLFVPQGSVIVSTRGRSPQTERTYRSSAAPMLPDVPVAVLMNDISASASEIVAGAIQDLDRGLVIGVPSYGKGLVQIVKPLPYNTSLKITTAKYYTPSGRSIQAIDYSRHDGDFEQIPDSLRTTYKTAAGRTVKDGRGIEPDVEVTLGDDSELEQALRRRAAFFFFANHYAAAHTTLPADLDMDAIYKDFRTWLGTQDFSYHTSAERTIARVSEDLAATGYAGASDEVAALQDAIVKEKNQDFDRHADRLENLLRAEIMARFATERVQIQSSLAHDPQFRQAIALVEDADAYSKALR